MNNIKYLKYLIKHKFYVTRECFRIGLYWRGLVHDLSKFNPMEWVAYRNYFYGGYTRPYADFNAGMKCEYDRTINKIIPKTVLSEADAKRPCSDCHDY